MSTPAPEQVTAQVPAKEPDATVEEHHPTGEHNRVIAIAVDYSIHARHALDWAIKNMIKKESDLVVLMHVRPDVVPSAPYGMGYVDLGDALYQMEKAERANSHALLKDLAKIVKDHGAAVRAVALRGDAREELLRKVTELEASALVVGSRGLGVIKRAFLGSVSDYLAHNCSIPLVIVKDDK